MNILFYVALAFACVYGAPTKDEIICEPGSSSKLDCNTCICSPDGTRIACTRMLCLGPSKYFNEDESLKSPGELSNSSFIRNKRNTKVCEPGSSFNVDCNRCRCSTDGSMAACTRRLCLKSKRETNPEAEKRIRSADRWGPVYIQGRPCTPGALFYSECNSCVCEANGRSAGCTLMFCL